MKTNDGLFEIALYRGSLRLVQAAIPGSWVERLIADARFSGSRAGVIPTEETSFRVSVRPVWCVREGQALRPVVSDVAVELEGADSGTCFRKEFFYQEFLAPLAQQFAATLVSLRLLAPGDVYCYLLLAPDGQQGALDEQRELPLRVQRRQPPPAQQSTRVAADEFPVFIAARALRAFRAHVAANQQQEAAGFLLGLLGRAPGSSELFLEVTEFIPAYAVESTPASVKLKAESWAAALDAIEHRGLGEEIVGWAHSHPFQPHDFDSERRTTAPTANLFLSSQDTFIHETMFGFPWAVALVADGRPGVASEDLPVALFGWRQGLLAHRGFHLCA